MSIPVGLYPTIETISSLTARNDSFEENKDRKIT